MEPSLTPNHTICAISTPPGTGGIAVVRVAGTDAINIVASLWKGADLTKAPSHSAHLGWLLHTPNGQPLDQCIATIFRQPHSYTSDNTVELSLHGSPYIQQAAIQALCQAGAKPAQPGEFTKRAFLAGNLDLTQAEAVADIIASQSRAAHRIAISQMRGQFTAQLQNIRQQLIDLAALLELELDFGDEHVEFADRTQLLNLAQSLCSQIQTLEQSFARGQAIKQGIPVAIVGPTNVGKSSLLNALVGDDKAIVSHIHGTTRDLIEDTATIGDYLFRFVDTAGLRDTTDTIEAIGINRAHQAMAKATIILKLIDASRPQTNQPLPPQANPQATVITILNKTDLPHQPIPSLPNDTIHISTLTQQGLDQLRQALIQTAQGDETPDQIIITNQRHRQALADARESAQRVIQGLTAGISADFIAQDLREAIHHLGQITGQITTDTLLHTIFSRFCIGK